MLTVAHNNNASEKAQRQPLSHKLKQIYEKWSKLRPISFVLVTTVVMKLIYLPLGFVFELLEISQKAIGGPKPGGLVHAVVGAVILAPIIETVLFQSLPINIIKKSVKWKTNILAVTVSALLFSLAHLPYSFWYFLLMIPPGLLLASTYIIFKQRRESAFWITASVHSLWNLIAVIIHFATIEINNL